MNLKVIASDLATYASHPDQSRGRRFAELPAPTRTDFQRDRDRIIHSTAFRRLVYKTQVFLNHEGDLFRTRLTHSLEVAQLGRSIARALRLHEDLVEAIALAHDLGHPPFGHAGQDALNGCMKALGTIEFDQDDLFSGFEHNLQSLRVVDTLEERYPAFDGLNLCFETREGILKHCSRANAECINNREPGGVAARFLHGGSPSLEAQLCNLADEIAYNAHDIDDGVRSGLLSLSQLADVPLFDRCRRRALQAYPALNGKRLLFESIRLMLCDQIGDVIAATRRRLVEVGVHSADQARQTSILVDFSPTMRAESHQLKAFLFRNLYRHPKVLETTDRARQIVTDLFDLYVYRPVELPEAYASKPQRTRVVADYIAGMTDRFAIHEHQRLTNTTLFP